MHYIKNRGAKSWI